MRLTLPILACATSLAACSPDTNEVVVRLAPEVVSSIDGSTGVRATVLADRTPASGEAVRLSVTYADRNGTAHDIAPVDGVTDDRGVFEATISGLTWDGTGTATVTVLDGDAPLMVDGAAVASAATFAVLDRTPPTLEILPPTADLHVLQGADIEVSVRVQDEIGVSEVFFEAAGASERQRSTVVASGSTDATVQFQMTIPDNADLGPTIMLYALAGDLSGNQAAAASITLTVDPRP